MCLYTIRGVHAVCVGIIQSEDAAVVIVDATRIELLPRRPGVFGTATHRSSFQKSTVRNSCAVGALRTARMYTVVAVPTYS